MKQATFKNDVDDGGVESAARAVSAMEGELRRGEGWSVGSWGRDCARGDVAGRWRADVLNILGGCSGGGDFGYGGVSPEHALSLP